ncbi:MAG TPA: hypothetical protein VGV59_13045 [Pyrinomonadaceae bacterium]|nr:hypothetical protein [Pyrinomonadaceae bacterium]
MSEKRSKYDTDPLDPGFARRTEEVFGGQTGATDASAPAAPQPERETPPPAADEPTRRFQEKYPTSYPSVFVPPVYQPPPPAARAPYAPPPPPQPQVNVPPPPAASPYPPPQYPPPPVAPAPTAFYAPQSPHSTRQVEKLGLPENVACVLPYVPFYIGLVASVIELLLVPRAETRTRFHAAQGMALQLAILALTLVFNFIGAVTGNWAGSKAIGLASIVFLVFSMWRVWEGRPHHLAPLDEATNLLNQKIAPRP